MVGKLIVSSTLIAAALLVLVLQTTNPSTVGPLGLLATFLLLYVVFMGCVTELIWVGSKLIAWLSRRVRTRRPLHAMSLARSYYFATVWALAPVMMLAMQSIGSLGFYEFILILVFLGVGTLYVSRRSTR